MKQNGKTKAAMVGEIYLMLVEERAMVVHLEERLREMKHQLSTAWNEIDHGKEPPEYPPRQNILNVIEGLAARRKVVTDLRRQLDEACES